MLRFASMLLHPVTYNFRQGANEVKVTLLDQSTYSAKVVGFDPDKDVAVLQLDMPQELKASLQPVSLGSSTGLMVGQRVYAIGEEGLDACALAWALTVLWHCGCGTTLFGTAVVWL
jgi:S1-C subfamily serine protease